MMSDVKPHNLFTTDIEKPFLVNFFKFASEYTNRRFYNSTFVSGSAKVKPITFRSRAALLDYISSYDFNGVVLENEDKSLMIITKGNFGINFSRDYRIFNVDKKDDEVKVSYYTTPKTRIVVGKIRQFTNTYAFVEPFVKRKTRQRRVVSYYNTRTALLRSKKFHDTHNQDAANKWIRRLINKSNFVSEMHQMALSFTKSGDYKRAIEILTKLDQLKNNKIINFGLMPYGKYGDLVNNRFYKNEPRRIEQLKELVIEYRDSIITTLEETAYNDVIKMLD